MGYYIETGALKGKADALVALYQAERITYQEAEKIALMKMGETAVIVVIDNGPFEAAGFAFSKVEFDAFHYGDNPRRKEYLKMKWSDACEASGFEE